MNLPKFDLYKIEKAQIKGVIEDVYIGSNYVQYIVKAVKYNEKFILNTKIDKYGIGDLILLEDIEIYPLNFSNNYLLWDENILYKITASRVILLKKGKGEFLKTLRVKLIYKLNKLLSTFEEDKKNFLKAIVIGEKKELDESIKNLFIETGTSHLLAISGLHVSFILSFLTSLVPLRRILSRIIFFPILLFYGWILGENPPVWRVIGQYAFVTMAFLLRKEEDSLNAIFWVALINLIISPLKLFNVSFQLSYMAMLGLLYKPNFSKFLPNYLQEIWESSFWLFIFLLPLNLYYFGKIPFISILSNFFAIPVFSIILFLTFIFIWSSLFSVGNFLGSILSLLISILFSGLHLLLYHYKISLLISLFLIILPIFSRKREV